MDIYKSIKVEIPEKQCFGVVGIEITVGFPSGSDTVSSVRWVRLEMPEWRGTWSASSKEVSSSNKQRQSKETACLLGSIFMTIPNNQVGFLSQLPWIVHVYSNSNAMDIQAISQCRSLPNLHSVTSYWMKNFLLLKNKRHFRDTDFVKLRICIGQGRCSVIAKPRKCYL